MKELKKKPLLSIVILNYNTKNLLFDCLYSLEKIIDEIDFEVIVVDNGSTDGSIQELQKSKFSPSQRLSRVGDNNQNDRLKLIIIENRDNLGFAKGNNVAKNSVNGKYVVFLNSDTIVYSGALKTCVDYLEKHKDVGAISCKVVLSDGSLDKDTRRSFITPWIGFVHIFTRLDRIFPRSKLIAKYWYGYLPEDQTHEVDAIQGAFFMSPKEVLDKVGWFDEDYFLDGEDIDLSWKIKEAGFKVIYYPKGKILHLKGVTKGKNKDCKKDVSLKEKMKYRMASVNSMEIFVKKRLWSKYPLPLMLFVLLGIKALKLMRTTKLLILG